MNIQIPSENQVNSVLRHVGTSAASVASVFVVLGFLTPDQAQEVIASMQDIVAGLTQAFGGFSKLALIIGPVFATVMATLAAKSGTAASLLATVLKIATGPKGAAAVSAQNAIISATNTIAQDPSIPASKEASNALIAAAVGLPNVQAVITDPITAKAIPSPSVVSAKVD